MNIFEKESLLTKSGNGSVKYTTTLNPFLDDFASISKYRQLRDASEIYKTMEHLWTLDPLTCLKEAVYIRLISRDAKYMQEVFKKQIGQGLKHEFFHRIIWILKNHSEVFENNWRVFVSAGSWDDMFEILRLIINDETTSTYLVFSAIVAGLQDNNEKNLVKKYLPTMKSKPKCTTPRTKANHKIAKILCNIFGISAQEYRHLKAEGTAHTFQQLISKQEYDKINFDTLPGRVLGTFTKTRDIVRMNNKTMRGDGTTFIERHGLQEKFEKWLDARPVAKFTGFVYELFANLNPANKLDNKVKDKQFLGLVESQKHSNIDSSFIVCVDTSGSMRAPARGTSVSSYCVAISIALYFSQFLTGKFENSFLEFAHTTTIRNWVGDTPTQKFLNTSMSGCCSNTNVLSVARLLVDLHEKGYSENEFPKGVILVSDGEFDSNNSNSETTFKIFRDILARSFSEDFVKNFKIVLWDVPNNYYDDLTPKFESFANEPNCFYLSGFDPAGISFLFGKEPKTPEEKVVIPKTAEELFAVAMDQDLLNLLKI